MGARGKQVVKSEETSVFLDHLELNKMNEIMGDVEEEKRRTRPLRNRKTIVKSKEIFSSDLSDRDSSDYNPVTDFEDYTSDDSTDEIRGSFKKRKKTSYSVKSEDSDDCFPKTKRKFKKNIRKTNNNGAQGKVRGNKSKSRGRPPSNKSIVQELENMTEYSANNRRRKKGSQQVQKKNNAQVCEGPYSVIGNWYLASGFMKDLTALFEAFDEQDSWRFTAFALCWQKQKFSLIYRGRYNFKELLEFSEEIFLWTIKFLSPYHHLKWRVGALYTLYGLFYKHPFRYLYKIRMEIKAYENMVNLVRIFHYSAENPDPAYIFYKLTAAAAFYHVASSDEMGLHLDCPQRRWQTIDYEVNWELQPHSSESIFSEHSCNIQKTVMEEYEKVKMQMWGNDGKGLDKAFSYVQPKILSEVHSALAELRHDDHSEEATSSQASDVNQSHTASTESTEIGQRVSEIRMKAASSCTTNEFLQRKLLRSPRKNTVMKDSQRNSESVTGSVSDHTSVDNLYVHDNDEKVATFGKIMEFMQPTEEDSPNIPFRSLRNRENKRVHIKIKDEIDSEFDSDSEMINSQDALLSNDSSEEELQANVTSFQASLQKRGRKRKTNAAQMSLQKSCIKKKPRNTSLPKQKKIRKSQKKNNPRNSCNYEPHDNSQIIEKNEIIKRESEPENLTSGEVMISNTSVSRKQSHKKKKAHEKDLQNEPRPLKNKQNRSRNIPNQDNLEHECTKKPTNLQSLSSEETVSPAVVDQENKSFSENICVEAVANDVHEGFHNQTIAGKNVHEESQGHGSVIIATNIPDDSDDNTNLIHVKNEPNFMSASDINDMGNTENSTQMNNKNNIERILQVEVLATLPKKRSLRSILNAKSMVYVVVNFHEDNVKVHTVKFKMSKVDLKVIHCNREKLNALKKRLHSLLPLKYKNYDLHLQLNIHQSVLEEIEACETKPFAQGFEAFEENDCEQEKYKQGSQTFDSLLVKTETMDEIDCVISHEEPMTSCTHSENVSSLMTEDYHIPSSILPESCDDMNHLREVIQVEIEANTQENCIGVATKTESTTILDVNFHMEGVRIHQVKFQISIEEFETLLNKKNMLESLMKIFRSFLPSSYQMYEMQLHSVVQRSVTDSSLGALQHSRQDSYPPEILPDDDTTTPFKAGNTTLNRQASTSPSQKSLSKNLTNFHSESLATQVPQLPNVGEVKDYISLRPELGQGQYNINTTAQPTYLTSEPVYLQRTTESSVNMLISEGSQLPESYSIPNSNSEGNYFHLSNIPSKTQCQILPHKIIPPNYGDKKPDIMLIDERVTSPQVYRMDTECQGKLLGFQKSTEAKHAHNGMENSGHDINNSLESHACYDMHFSSNISAIRKNTPPLKECINDSDTESCTMLWKFRSSLDSVSDKNVLPSLPHNDNFEMVGGEQKKTVTGTVRNINHDEPFVSGSSSSDTSMNNSLPPQPHFSSTIGSVNSIISGRAASKANDSTVCSFYFFSKTKKYNASLNKQKKISSDSDIKKPSVKFLFMEKLFSKKKH